MFVKLYLPLALIHMLLQALQVGQEGLIELWQLGVLFETWPELSDNTLDVRHISHVNTHRIQSATYLHEILQLRLHADKSVLQFLMGGNTGVKCLFKFMLKYIQSLHNIQDNIWNLKQVCCHLDRVKLVVFYRRQVWTYSHGCRGVLIQSGVHQQRKAVHGHLHPHWSHSCKQTNKKINWQKKKKKSMTLQKMCKEKSAKIMKFGERISVFA